MSENLLPCPFCGGDQIEMHPRDLATIGSMLPHQGGDAQYAHCDGCGAEGPQSFHEHEAIEHWNNRAPAPPSSREERGRGMAKPKIDWRTMFKGVLLRMRASGESNEMGARWMATEADNAVHAVIAAKDAEIARLTDEVKAASFGLLLANAEIERLNGGSDAP